MEKTSTTPRSNNKNKINTNLTTQLKPSPSYRGKKFPSFFALRICTMAVPEKFSVLNRLMMAVSNRYEGECRNLGWPAGRRVQPLLRCGFSGCEICHHWGRIIHRPLTSCGQELSRSLMTRNLFSYIPSIWLYTTTSLSSRSHMFSSHYIPEREAA